jgi:hypothetical protein
MRFAHKSHPKSDGMSNREIARHLHTSESTIRRLRKELSASRDAHSLRVVKRGSQIFAMKTEMISPANIMNRGRTLRSFAALRREVALVLENVRSEHGKAVVRIIGHWIDGSLESAKAASAIDGLLERHRRYGGYGPGSASLCK